LGSKSKDSNIFKLNLNWGQIGINSNELFEDFSNLELFKISFEYSNSNQGFKRMTFKNETEKDFKTKIESF
jgi:hypothetical protein